MTDGSGTQNAEGMTVTVTKDGPYRVAGSVPLARQTIETDDDGISVEWREGETFSTSEEYSLCRCGRSATRPFCDEAGCEGFDGTETASREPYLAIADEQDGPSLILTDAEQLCAYARFCDYGDRIWNLVEEPGDEARALTIREGIRCPSGRLVAWDRSTKEAFELDVPPSIGVVEDPQEGVSGPLWLRGGIQVIASDGYRYEVRNRQTVCRCGQSGNKPFCDGSHASIRFDDGHIND